VCGEIFFLISAKSQAALKARLSCRVEIGSIRLRPGTASPQAGIPGNTGAAA
jgi:hypothetical protein